MRIDSTGHNQNRVRPSARPHRTVKKRERDVATNYDNEKCVASLLTDLENTSEREATSVTAQLDIKKE